MMEAIGKSEETFGRTIPAKEHKKYISGENLLTKYTLKLETNTYTQSITPPLQKMTGLIRWMILSYTSLQARAMNGAEKSFTGQTSNTNTDTLTVVINTGKERYRISVLLECDAYNDVTLTQRLDWGHYLPIATLKQGKWEFDGRESRKVFGQLCTLAGDDLKQSIANARKNKK